MNSLRVEKKDIYRIEVNDDGECIEFDLADINLPIKCYKALDDLEELNAEMTKKEQELIDRNATEREHVMLENDFYNKQRKIVDSFLGEGACQKIFGDRNYFSMFDDLIDELTIPREELNGKSHFDMLDVTSNGIKKRIANKYNKKQKYVI